MARVGPVCAESAAKHDQGEIHVAWKLPEYENEKNRMEQPPDVGRCKLAIDNTTRAWKGDQPANLTELTAGDELLVNLTGSTATSRGRCTDIWIGAETHKAVTAHQRVKHYAFLRERGLPAWIEEVEGRKLVVTLFYGTNRKDFKTFFDEHFKQGQEMTFALADDTLRLIEPEASRRAARLTDNRNIPTVAYGCSGTRITLEMGVPNEVMHKGSLVRLFAKDWPAGAAQQPPPN